MFQRFRSERYYQRCEKREEHDKFYERGKEIK